jgi:shikimate dehydrogenase
MRQFGLLGQSLAHSFSPSYFAQKFEREGILEARYDLFELPQIDALPDLLAQTPQLAGLNVTIPYKEAVLPYLDALSEEAEAVGAVNTIAFEQGRLVGYNTDVLGFEEALLLLLPNNHTLQQALILGTGGASKAVAYVLKRMNFSYTYVSRKEAPERLTYQQLTAEQLGNVSLIVNTTPVGQYPAVIQAPNLPYSGLGAQHFLMDLIYNPAETLFLKRGQQAGAKVLNGLPMLEAQAEAAWRIWNNT